MHRRFYTVYLILQSPDSTTCGWYEVFLMYGPEELHLVLEKKSLLFLFTTVVPGS